MIRTLTFIAVASAALLCPEIAFSRTDTRLPAKAPVAGHKVMSRVQENEFAGDTWKDLGSGKFCDPVMSNMFNGYPNSEVLVDVQESVENPGVFRIVNPWPTAPSHPSDNLMIVDARDPEYVHVPGQVTPVYEKADGVTWICSFSYYGKEYADNKDTKEDFMKYFAKYNITREDDVIFFPPGCMMYMWPDATSSYAKPGQWVTSYGAKYSGYLILPGKTADEQEWKELGKGLMRDGFLYSFINPAVEAITTDVTVLENTRMPGKYKLLSPFRYVSADSEDLIINAEDPDFVRIYEQNTGIGFTSGGEDWGKMWCYSFNSLYNFPTLDALIASGYEDINITLSDNTIWIPARAIVFYFPKISEVNYYDNEDAVDSYIILPDPSSVESLVDDGAAEVEYYTLQGVRVTAPVPGDLVIERRGSVARKIIYNNR